MRYVFIIAQQVLREIRHTKTVWLFVMFLSASWCLCEFIGSVALIEAREFQLAIFGNLIRWSAVVLLLQFTVDSVHREFNDKTLDYLFAMPMSRGHYILGKALGLAIVAAIFALLSLLALSLYHLNAAILAWLLSLYLELLIIACLALFISISLPNSAVAAVVLLSFYILCRALASIELLASQPLVQSSNAGQILIEGVVSLLCYLFPALYQFANTAWLLYMQFDPAVLMNNFMQSLVYCSLLLSAAMFDLYRKAL